ncbi:MAG: Gfo/Idh/MocA family oxidoreductase [Verrucomicrobia bacterium]|nr:Gfo/Idh/MocA family oxidoreductase [Verrucomicrobiota bacterium]
MHALFHRPARIVGVLFAGTGLSLAARAADVVFHDDFSGLKVEMLSAGVIGAEAEYHYVPKTGRQGNWEVSCFRSEASQRAWRVICEGGFGRNLVYGRNAPEARKPASGVQAKASLVLLLVIVLVIAPVLRPFPPSHLVSTPMKTPIHSSSRRRLLRQTAFVGALAFPAVRRTLAAGSANGDIRVAIIGLGGKGKNHVKGLLPLPGARLAALCDVDPQRLAAQVEVAQSAGVSPFTATDPRRILERKDVDAVIIATPNHWHALLAVWACRAGKDVYVEKPVSHNVWEGAQIVAAARQHGRIVQGSRW